MAPRKQVPIKALIDGLFNKLGDNPLPSHQQIRIEVGEIRKRTAEFEDIAGAPDFASQNEDLKAELEAKEKELASLKANFESYKADSASQIDSLTKELEALRKEQEKRSAKQREVDAKQLQILQIISGPNGPSFTVHDIHRGTQIPVDEIEVALNDLHQPPGLVSYGFNGLGAPIWTRTIEGNKYVIAERAKAVAATPKRKFKDLPDIEDRIIAIIVGHGEGIREDVIHAFLEGDGIEISLQKVKFTLRKMDKRLVSHDDMEETYELCHKWFPGEDAPEYLDERGKL